MGKQSLKNMFKGLFTQNKFLGLKCETQGNGTKKLTHFLEHCVNARNAAKDAMVKHICLAHAVYIENKGKAAQWKEKTCSVNGPYMEWAVASRMPYLHHMTGCVMQLTKFHLYCNFRLYIELVWGWCNAAARTNQ